MNLCCTRRVPRGAWRVARAAWVETSVPTRELPLKKRHTFYSVGEILLDVTPPALFVSKAIHQRQSNLTGARLEVFGNGG